MPSLEEQVPGALAVLAIMVAVLGLLWVAGSIELDDSTRPRRMHRWQWPSHRRFPRRQPLSVH